MEYCVETRNRIKLTVAAYAYEFRNHSIMTDAEFDELSLRIDPSKATTNPLMDRFFQTAFDPCTGMWIHRHPELERVAEIYDKYYA